MGSVTSLAVMRIFGVGLMALAIWWVARLLVARARK